MSEQTVDMLERALGRNHSGDWPLVMPSDILALVEAYRRKDQRIATLERERALLLRYVRTAEYITPIFDDDDDAEVVADFLAARRALIDAGLLEGGA